MSTLKAIVPAFWGRKTMTVCIAAAASITEKPTIIMCADMLSSSSIGKAETNLKIKLLPGNWYALTSGFDHEIRGVMRLLHKGFREVLLGSSTALGPGENEIDETTIVPLVKSVMLAWKREKAETYVNGRFGITYAEFLTRGKDIFPAEIHREASFEIRELRMGTEMIICGFAQRLPHLVLTDDLGGVHLMEDFAVCGEGQHLASSVMLSRQHSDVHGLERSLYTVWEAKRYAQGAPSVGEHTSLQVLTAEGERKTLTIEGRKVLSDLYEKYGPRLLPKEMNLSDEFPENGFMSFGKI